MARKRRKSRSPTALATPQSTGIHTSDWIVVVLAGVGMVITGYLSVVALSGAGVALCSEGSGCDLVQQSRWSTLLGLPVALWGFATYALLALIAWYSPPRLKRWRRLWIIAFLGLTFSVYLTVVGWLALDAWCLWCLMSLVTLTVTFLYLTAKAPTGAPGMPWSRWGASSAVVAIVLLGTVHAYYSDLFSPPEDPRLEQLAVHLSNTGARYYGASWCPACREQHRLFRGASDQLPYVECSPDGRQGRRAPECLSAGVTTFPSWTIRGRTYEGVLQPVDLARYSGFDWQGAR